MCANIHFGNETGRLRAFLCQALIVFVLRRAALLFNPFHSRCDAGNGFSSSIVQTVEIPASALAEQTVSHAVFASRTIWDSKSLRHKLQSGLPWRPAEGCLISLWCTCIERGARASPRFSCRALCPRWNIYYCVEMSSVKRHLISVPTPRLFNLHFWSSLAY